jgi:hypothetical protein
MRGGESCSLGRSGEDDAARDSRVGVVSDVLFIDDLARILRTSRSTIERRRRSGTFPIPELPAIDERPRWSRQAVEGYLASSASGLRSRRGRPARRGRVQ